MSLLSLISNYNNNFANYKSLCNCSCSCGYGNSYGLANFMSVAMMALPLLMSGGMAISNLTGAIGSLGTGSAAARGSSSGSFVSGGNSIFTYGNDYKTDYAADAVKAYQKQLNAILKDLSATDTPSLDTKQTETDKQAEDKKTAYDAATNTTKEAQTNYNKASANVTNLENQLQNATDENKASIKAQLKTAQQEEKTAKNALDDAQKAEEKAKAEYDEAVARQTTVKNEIAQAKELEQKINDYKALDAANGSSKAQRATSAVAHEGVTNGVLELQNVRQLLNEYASAKRSYEAIKNPTDDDKAKFKEVAQRFLDECSSVEGGDLSDNTTIMKAYEVIVADMKKIK